MPFNFNGEEPTSNRDGSRAKTNSPHGFQNTGSGMSARGFQNTPERKNYKSSLETFHTPSSSVHTRDTHLRKARQRRSLPKQEIIIPWKILLMIAGICILVVALWINRDAITMFLSQVLSWVITIVIIIFLVKIFIFRR